MNKKFEGYNMIDYYYNQGLKLGYTEDKAKKYAFDQCGISIKDDFERKIN